MAVLSLIFGSILAIVAGGLLFAAFEKFLSHRAEMARLSHKAESRASADLLAQIDHLNAEVLALRERLDEHAILLDDVSRLRPILVQSEREEPSQSHHLNT